MKKIKLTKISVFFLATAVVSVALAAAQVLYSAAGTSSFKYILDDQDMGHYIQTVRDDYLWSSQYVSGATQHYLVSYKQDLKRYLSADGVEGKISWNVRTGNNLQTVLWSRSENVTAIRVNSNRPLLITSLDGCCAEMTGHRMFDIQTGQLLMSFNDFNYEPEVIEPFVLEVPNSNLSPRYVGLISGDSTRDVDFVPATPGYAAAALVKYGNPTLKQKLQLEVKAAPNWGISILKVEWRKDPNVANSSKIDIQKGQGTLWNIDGSNDPNQISGLMLYVEMDAGFGTRSVNLPVRGDKFDLTHISGSSDVLVNALQ